MPEGCSSGITEGAATPPAPPGILESSVSWGWESTGLSPLPPFGSVFCISREIWGAEENKGQSQSLMLKSAAILGALWGS